MSSTQVGHERDIVRACLGAVVNSHRASEPQILAAFEVSNFVPGSVYIEARDPGAVSTAIHGLNGVPRTPRIDFVPLEDRPALLDCQTISKAAKWVRVGGGGTYRGDLGYAISVDQSESEATVLLVPRLSADGQKSRDRKRARQACPNPRIFDPRLSSLPFDQLEDGRVVFNGKTFRGGLVQMIFSDHQLRLETPTAEELAVFDRSQGMEVAAMAKAWSYCSANALTPECQVRLSSGEQSGLIGRVLSISGGITQFLPDETTTVIDVLTSDLRLHFCVGDYVRVKAGRFAGSVGWVTNAEYRLYADLITFIDEASAANGEPKEVSILLVITKLYLTHPQITMTCFVLESYDPPLESTFYPHSILAQDITPQWNATEVIIIGAHESSGRLGTICAPAEFNDSGIKSFTVQLHPDNRKIIVETTNLVLRLVVEFDHDQTELTETN